MPFEEWLRLSLPALLRFATVICGSPDLAEDVIQDVVVKVSSDWGRIAALQDPDAYVRRMVINQHLSWRRKWSRLVPAADPRVPTSTRPGFEQAHADRAELLGELRRLPRRQRTVLVLRYFADLSVAETAVTLGCTESTVRAHAARALATLRIGLRPDPSLSTPAPIEDFHAH